MNRIYIKKKLKKLGVKRQKISIICSVNWLCKNHRKIGFHPEAPVQKYHQQMSNNCYLSSLASTFYSIGYNSDATSLANRIEE